MFTDLLQSIFEVMIHMIATTTAAILNHPAMQDAGARLVVEGMNRFVQQPNLAEHLRVMDANLAEFRAEAARNAGKDLPAVAKEFWKGVLSASQDEQDKQSVKEDEAKKNTFWENLFPSATSKPVTEEETKTVLQSVAQDGLRRRGRATTK